MPISLPTNPSIGATYDYGGIHYIYNGDGWVNKSIYGVSAGSGISFANYNGTGPVVISIIGGATGATGATGAQGEAGQSSNYYNYKVHTATQSPPTGNGEIRYNNATQTSSTILYVDHLDDNGDDIDIFLSLLKQNDNLIIQDASDSNNYQTWRITSAPTVILNDYTSIPVTGVTSAGTGTSGFSNNNSVLFVVFSSPIATAYVESFRGLTGAVGFTNSSGIGLSVSGNTLTISNTGVLSFNGVTGAIQGVSSINGSTGAITNVAFTNAAQTFSALQSFSAGISASGGITFGNDITINGLRVGRGGAGDVNSVAVGSDVLPAGTFNVAIGKQALSSTVGAINNIAIGYQSARDCQNGINNVSIGSNALDNNIDGSVNVAVGNLALSTSSVSNQNTAIGSSSLQNTTTGFRNTAIGYLALEKNTSGVANVAIGHAAGAYRGDLDILFPNDLDNEEPNIVSNRTTGTGGIYIGQWSRASNNGNENEIVIGTNALGLGSNTAVIGASSQVSATIYGIMNLPGGLSASGGITFAGTVSSDTGYRISSSAINSQTGTTYTFLIADNGEVITFNNVSAITVTIPTGLPVGFNCTAIQLGAGQVGFTGAAGVTLNSYGSLLKIAGQHGAATVISYSSNIYNIAGTLST